MLRSTGVILFSIVFSISPLDGRHLEVEGTMDWKPEDQSGYVRFQEAVDLERSWNDFKKEHGKTYKDSNEEEDRKKIFEENMKEIALHNERYAKGEETYEQGINQFGDLTNSEFVKLINVIPAGKNRTKLARNNTIPDDLRRTQWLPAAADWRPTGAVSRVKNQGNCRSGYAFGATGALEGAMYLKSRGKMVPLSEQNILDCSHWTSGCYGGWAYEAYHGIMYEGGIDSEDSYQYEAQRGSCRYNPQTKAARVLGVVALWRRREDILQRAVAYYGPISVLIDAAGMQFYRSGIYSNSQCRQNSWWELNHIALVVGYKSAGPGRDYWIVKNSWGTSWGMDGYILMTRNQENQCGIATEAVFPII